MLVDHHLRTFFLRRHPFSFVILVQLALLVRYSSSTLYSFGYQVPTSIAAPPNPPNGGTNTAYLATNVVFGGSYYIVGFELYTTAAASFQVAIDTWASSGYFNCWSSPNSCATSLNSLSSIGTFEFSSGSVVTFTAQKNYNYCEFTTPIHVTSGKTLELIQSTSGASGNIFGIDSGTSATYPDTVIKSISGGRVYIEKMDPTQNKRIYVRAWGYSTNPGTTGTGTCLSAFALTTTTTTTTTTKPTTTTTKTTTTSTTTKPTTTATTETTTTGSTVSTSTNTAAITTTGTTSSTDSTTTITDTTTTASTSSSTLTSTSSSSSTTTTTTTTTAIITTTLNTLGPIVEFSPTELVSLISSNYSGDLSGCLVNCSSNGYCYVDPTTGKIGCACNANFTGVACSNDLRACSSSPCSNGGNCIDTIVNTTRSFYCECGQYYYGSLCQNIINVCANQTCSSHGSCADVNHTATCNCFTGYLGTSCENEEQSLKVTKQIIQSTSIIAIAFIVLFYLIFVLCDLHSWYVGRRRRRYNERYGRKKKNGGAHKNNSVGVGIYRVQYVS